LPFPVGWKLMAMADPMLSGTSMPLSYGLRLKGSAGIPDGWG
jgi:hypothetical protein